MVDAYRPLTALTGPPEIQWLIAPPVQQSALTQAPVTWHQFTNYLSQSGTQKDRKKCGSTFLPYNDSPFIWG